MAKFLSTALSRNIVGVGNGLYATKTTGPVHPALLWKSTSHSWRQLQNQEGMEDSPGNVSGPRLA